MDFALIGIGDETAKTVSRGTATSGMRNKSRLRDIITASEGVCGAVLVRGTWSPDLAGFGDGELLGPWTSVVRHLLL
jgi:hypothetical protein